MKIGVISDTHGYLSPWNKAIENFFNDVDVIIHAGDLLYHGPRNPILDGYNPAELAKAVNNLDKPLLMCRGNCDCDVDQMITNWPILSPYTLLQDNNKRIMTLHGYKESAEELLDIAKKFKINIMITGHTHIRVLEVKEGIIFLNPGSVSIPKGDGIPSLAIIDNSEITIYDLNSKNILNKLII